MTGVVPTVIAKVTPRMIGVTTFVRAIMFSSIGAHSLIHFASENAARSRKGLPRCADAELEHSCGSQPRMTAIASISTSIRGRARNAEYVLLRRRMRVVLEFIVDKLTRRGGFPFRALPEVGAGIGNMIDELRLQRRIGLRLGAVGREQRGGGERQRIDELAAADLAGLELVELVCDEPFHGG